MKIKVSRRFLLLITSLIFIASGTMSFAQKSFHVIPVVKEVIVNEEECITCASIYALVEECINECDKLPSPSTPDPCHNGCTITGGLLKMNYLCPMENCP
jgi:hypothetical protein